MYETLDQLAEMMETCRGADTIRHRLPSGVVVEARPRYARQDRVGPQDYSVTILPMVTAWRDFEVLAEREYIIGDRGDIDQVLAEVVAEATRKDTPAEMREVARAAHDLEGAIAAAATARDSRDQAVRAARAAGHGPAKIAEAAGLSMAGYYKIVGAGS